MVACSQCGKPAIGTVNNVPVCVDCNLKVQQAATLQQASLMQHLNYLTDQMESTVGLYGVLPRYKIPQPVVNQINKGAITFNNINVDRSVIGAINTGNVQQIDVAMSQIKNSSNNELAEAFKNFTEAIINEKQLNKEDKNQLIEQVSFLASQCTAPKEARKPSIVKSVLSNVKDTVTTVVALNTLWDKLYPLIIQLFS